MAELTFRVESAASSPFCAAPQLALKLRVDNAGAPIHSVLLRCQVAIDAPRRAYSPSEEASLRDLFGEPSRFAQTLRSLLWAQVSVMVPAFSQSTTVELPLPCSYDLTLAAPKLLYALDGGEVPLLLLFSGTVFYQSENGLQVAPIPTTAETRFGLPAAVWQETMAHYYPSWAPLALRKDVFDRLYQFKQKSELRTWEETIERLLGRWS